MWFRKRRRWKHKIEQQDSVGKVPERDDEERESPLESAPRQRGERGRAGPRAAFHRMHRVLFPPLCLHRCAESHPRAKGRRSSRARPTSRRSKARATSSAGRAPAAKHPSPCLPTKEQSIEERDHHGSPPGRPHPAKPFGPTHDGWRPRRERNPRDDDRPRRTRTRGGRSGSEGSQRKASNVKSRVAVTSAIGVDEVRGTRNVMRMRVERNERGAEGFGG